MNLLLDTNIILNIVRAKDYHGIIHFINPNDFPLYISVVSEAEIKSIAIQNNWGVKRKNILDQFLEEVYIIEINQLYVTIYAEIDSYSQGRNTNFPDYPIASSRNMGKNDLWIASLAALLGLRLLTTDADFNHLNDVFLNVMQIKPSEFYPFF